MSEKKLTLISHHLCPYVQRSVITLTEKHIEHQRIYIDLKEKPAWFVAISPMGKVPVLYINEKDVVFESAVICEYLDETTPGALHPASPLEKARHRAWIEFGSQFLNDIAALYNAKSDAIFEMFVEKLETKLAKLDEQVTGPFFSGERFSLVDAAYGPVFRYFDVLDSYLPRDLFVPYDNVKEWRQQLAVRPSVINAVASDYGDRLRRFLEQRGSYLSERMEAMGTAVREERVG